MAEQIPFSIISDILVKLGALTLQEISYASGVVNDLTALMPKLDILNGVLVDAEKKQVESHAVRAWLRRLKDVVYDADDLLDDFATHQLQRGVAARQVSDFFSFSNQVVFPFKMSDKVKHIKMEVDEVVREIPPMLTHIQGNTVRAGVESSWRETHSFVLASEIVGREENRAEIIKLLLSADNQEVLSIVAIVGIGGLGKTTLAQLVYHDNQVVRQFEPRIWVCVSDNFNVRGLIIKILKDLHEQADVGRLELNGLKEKLHEKLRQKRFLLVLDDVWNDNYQKWDQLKSLLMVVEKGSKILVTARERRVTSIMGIDSPFPLEGLKEAQSWDLFLKLTSMDKLDKVHPRLIEIGKEIVSMCKGVPLVIKTLGSMLWQRPEENWWLSIKNSKNLLSLGTQNKNVLDVLRLSYDNLPIYLKQCFTYCAIFPKDHQIEKKLLVQLWMAQGYIQPLDVNIGNQYFDELLSTSLLEEFNSDGISGCKMHDLIHDLAQSIIGSDILLTEDDVNNKSERVHHVSIFQPQNLPQNLKVKHMRTLLYIIPTYYRELDSIERIDGPDFQCLRVLSLRGLWLKKVPKALEKLSHLRYLDLSYNRFEELPSSIARLKNLQTLKLHGCRVKKFPKGIRELISMRQWENDMYLSHMPCGIGELTLLQSLPIFVVGSGRGAGRLNELKELNNLRGELKIVGLENAKVGYGDANLRAKQYIQSLILEWGWLHPGNDEDHESVMEGLQPHPNLKELYVSGYGGLKFPSWGMRNGDGLNSVLPNLTTLYLRGWLRCQILPCLVGLPHLKSLELHDLKEVEKMECSSEGPFFPSLEKLTLRKMLKLKELWRRDLPNITPPSFSLLSQLNINLCDNLASLLLPPSPLLSKLVISECGNLASLQLQSSPLLSTLNMSFCPKLTSLLLPPSPLLSNLNIYKCDNLPSLQLHSSSLVSTLKMYHCPKLTSLLLPPSPLLSELEIIECDNLASLQLHSSPLLSTLKMSCCPKLTSLLLPPSPHLSQLCISECDDLASLEWHSSPLLLNLRIEQSPKLTCLKLASLPCLENIQLIGVEEWVVRELILSATGSSLKYASMKRIYDLMSLPDELRHHASTLQTLTIEECRRLATLPHWIGNLSSLMSLKIFSCPQLASLPDGMRTLQLLERLEIVHLSGLATLPDGIGSLSSLEYVGIEGCPQLMSLPEGMCSLRLLKRLIIGDCPDLETLPDGIGSLSSLKYLDIHGCPQLMSLPEGMRSLRLLQRLIIGDCSGLATLPDGIGSLSSLEDLAIYGCTHLMSLPEGMRSLPIPELKVSDCPHLVERCQRGKGEDWPKIAHVPYISLDGERV